MSVGTHIRTHDLVLIPLGGFRDAKTASPLALEPPDMLADLVAIDDPPICLPLTPDFESYIQSMRHVESANLAKLPMLICF